MEEIFAIACWKAHSFLYYVLVEGDFFLKKYILHIHQEEQTIESFLKS